MERERDASKADYVAITFESQKNANKMRRLFNIKIIKNCVRFEVGHL